VWNFPTLRYQEFAPNWFSSRLRSYIAGISGNLTRYAATHFQLLQSGSFETVNYARIEQNNAWSAIQKELSSPFIELKKKITAYYSECNLIFIYDYKYILNMNRQIR